MRKWIVEKWDWWVYLRAFHSMRRMCDRNPGFAILLKLHIEKYLKEHPPGEAVEHSATVFYDALSKTAER